MKPVFPSAATITTNTMTDIRRRDLLVGAGFALLGKATRAGVISGSLPWAPNAATPPLPARPGGWQFFTASEAVLVEALADRIIPPDPGAPGKSGTVPAAAVNGATSGEPRAAPDLRNEWCPGGKDAGCVVFLDRQLAGGYGRGEGLYRQGPFQKGTKQQGYQGHETPAEQYRTWLAALDRYCRSLKDGKPFEEMPGDRQDVVLSGLEGGTVELEGVDGKEFMQHLVNDLQMGFFADPVYGGNRDMCAWKMIGFPGAHYDYRDWIDRHNERYPYPPVAITGRPGWTPGRG